MSALTSAITKHDHAAIAAALASEPSSASEAVSGWLPIQWAEKSGNLVTFVRTARLISHPLNESLAQERLRQYTALVSSTDYEPTPIDQAAQMVWLAVIEGAKFKVDRWQRPLLSSQEQALDFRYLLSAAGISSPEQLASVVKNA